MCMSVTRVYDRANYGIYLLVLLLKSTQHKADIDTYWQLRWHELQVSVLSFFRVLFNMVSCGLWLSAWLHFSINGKAVAYSGVCVSLKADVIYDSSSFRNTLWSIATCSRRCRRRSERQKEKRISHKINVTFTIHWFAMKCTDKHLNIDTSFRNVINGHFHTCTNDYQAFHKLHQTIIHLFYTSRFDECSRKHVISLLFFFVDKLFAILLPMNYKVYLRCDYFWDAKLQFLHFIEQKWYEEQISYTCKR